MRDAATKPSSRTRAGPAETASIDAKTGEVVLSEGETCEICGSTELVTLLDSQGALLQTRLAAMGYTVSPSAGATRGREIRYTGGEVIRAHGDDALHAAQVDTDPAPGSAYMAFQ